MNKDKEISWVGSSYDDLLAFPAEPRSEAGFQLGKVQAGLEPTDWKPFDEVGAGTREIRIKEASGIYRVIKKDAGDQQAGQSHCRSALPRCG